MTTTAYTKIVIRVKPFSPRIMNTNQYLDVTKANTMKVKLSQDQLSGIIFQWNCSDETNYVSMPCTNVRTNQTFSSVSGRDWEILANTFAPNRKLFIMVTVMDPTDSARTGFHYINMKTFNPAQ